MVFAVSLAAILEIALAAGDLVEAYLLAAVGRKPDSAPCV
jgi:hypothetical protein